MKKIIAFDCDSTLSSIEGVDELARLAGPEILKQVENLTNQAMNGEIAIEEIFAKRLDLIQPTQDQCNQIGQMYLDTIEPTAHETIAKLQDAGWECLIISGGFQPCIQALASALNINTVEAVPLYFDHKGYYEGFDSAYPTTRNGGKPEILASIQSRSRPDQLVMVGDGVSDLETKDLANIFIGFTRYAAREQVLSESQYLASELRKILDILEVS